MRTKHRLVDAAMVLLLPLLMAYSLIGEAFHEFAGTLMLLLFLAHHRLNSDSHHKPALFCQPNGLTTAWRRFIMWLEEANHNAKAAPHAHR